jgi:high-affinity K+ transport system ATPase subunit B
MFTIPDAKVVFSYWVTLAPFSMITLPVVLIPFMHDVITLVLQIVKMAANTQSAVFLISFFVLYLLMILLFLNSGAKVYH